jgi:hypothetical protein
MAIDPAQVQWDQPDAIDPGQIAWDGATPLDVRVYAEPTKRQEMLSSRGGRILQGLRDPIDAGAQLLPRGLQQLTSLGGMAPNPVSDFFGSEAQRVDQMGRGAEQELQAAREATGQQGIDAYRLGGNILSPANLAVAGRAVAAVPQIGNRLASILARGAAGGAAVGALQPVTEGDFGEEKAEQIGIGAATGPLAELGAAGLARVIKPQLNRLQQTLMSEGVQLTPGQLLGGFAQRLEDAATSVPILGDAIRGAQRRSLESMNTAAANRALAPIGEKATGAGRETVQQVKDKLSAAYNKLLPQLQFKPDQQFSAEIQQLSQMASSLPPTQAQQFQNILRDKLINNMTPQGNMSGESFKLAESEIGRLAKSYRGAADADQRRLGDALASVVNSARQTLVRANPAHAERLAKINEGYAIYAVLRDAASRVGATEGVFTAPQLQGAVRAADKSVGKGRFATGQAKMQDLSDAARGVLPSTIPESGTTTRALINALTLGGSYAVNPLIPAGLVAGAGVYSQPGNALLRLLLAQRPAVAEPAAQLARQYGGVPLTAAVLPALPAGQ